MRVAEADALRRFDSPEQALALQNRDLYDKYVRFIGEVIIRSLGGTWTNKPLHDDGTAYLGLSLPWRKEPLTIPTLFTAALARRTGDEWAFVHRNLRKRRDADRP